jgi:hypothetical protein
MSKFENLKRSIKTICQQFPKFTENFDLADRELIYEFLGIVDHFEDADNKRGSLSKRFSDYSSNVSETQLYLETPFLWLTVCIAENAVYHLSISRFYAKDFYKFLLHQLRSLFPLIKNGLQLSALEYEELQIKCDEPNFILSSDEMELLRTTYTSLSEAGFDSLSSKHIKRTILRNMHIPRKYKTNSEIKRFFTLVGGKWWFLFRPSAFGLSRIFIHIHLAKDIILKEFIDFTDVENTVLGLSNVHKVRNSKSEYIGTLLIPTRDINLLYKYIKQWEDNNNLKLQEFEIIEQLRRSTAFSLYKPNIGWQDLPAKERQTILRHISLDEAEETLENNLLFINKPLIPLNWSFTDHPQPVEIIRLFCKIPDQFSFSRLPFDNIIQEKDKYISLGEIEQLKYLYNKKVLEVGFTPWRLIYNYSVNRYCIRIPKITFKKIIHFLKILPYAEIYFSRHQIYLWTRLRNKEVDWIRNRFRWTIFPVVRAHPISDLDFDWFEKDCLQWTRSKILQDT